MYDLTDEIKQYQYCKSQIETALISSSALWYVIGSEDIYIKIY